MGSSVIDNGCGIAGQGFSQADVIRRGAELPAPPENERAYHLFAPE